MNALGSRRALGHGLGRSVGAGGGVPSYTWYGVGGWHPSATHPAEAAIDVANVVAAYQPHWGAGTAFARTDAATIGNSYINIANPGTYNAAAGAAPGYNSASGWAWSGNKWLRTLWTPANAQTRSMLAEYSGHNTTGWLCGNLNVETNSRLNIQPYRASARTAYNNGSLIEINNGGTQTGNVGVAGNAGYINGAVQAGSMSYTSGTQLEVYLGCVNNGSAAGFANAGTMSSWVAFAVTLTANQIANIAWGMGVISGRVTI